ncbi:PrgI family protein [Salinactinospora qingdaonensis]|uniref:PrgI family protein n=1 Tax=Salinactinospora qingdaonensis TaxID=702744 RepID=A0ABP7FPR4_9ACTN
MARIRMPADIERDDPILAGLTARQLLIIGVPALAVWGAGAVLYPWVPLPVLAVLAVPLVGAAVAAALVRRDGLSLDRLAVAAWRYLRAAKRRTAHPVPTASIPSWIGARATPLPAPLDLPLQAIGDDGTIDLGEHGVAVILSCSTVNFGLRTPEEQAALVSGFASYLNSLATPAQFVVRAESVRLDPLIAALDHAAPGLPHPALERAAGDHAAYLAELAESRELLYRQVLMVLRAPASQGRQAVATVRRRADDAARALAGAGTTATVLDGARVAAVLDSAAAPFDATPPGEELASADEVITGAPSGEEA